MCETFVREGGTRYAFNDEQWKIALRAGVRWQRFARYALKVAAERRGNITAVVEEVVDDVENKTDENNNEASSWPMNLFSSTSFETEGDAEEKDELLVKDKKAPLGESSNISQNNNENVGVSLRRFFRR